VSESMSIRGLLLLRVGKGDKIRQRGHHRGGFEGLLDDVDDEGV
jgi:hypothetical protein